MFQADVRLRRVIRSVYQFQDHVAALEARRCGDLREEHERLTKVKGLSIFSSDNISSSAYGPEEIMHVLVLAGTGALFLTAQLAALIIVMLAIVTISYRQTIKAYPMGASSYIVASDNLGDRAGILAASALLIGYVVTVAVSVSAGVLAMTSILPELFDYRVSIGVALVVLLTLGNLRGIRESGTIFMAPTYLYIAVMLVVIAVGMGQLAFGGGIPQFQAPASWEGVEAGAQALSLFLVLRAFSQGAVALTGVEAISDGVPAFKAPEWRNARTTLTWAAAMLELARRWPRRWGHGSSWAGSSSRTSRSRSPRSRSTTSTCPCRCRSEDRPSSSIGRDRRRTSPGGGPSG